MEGLEEKTINLLKGDESSLSKLHNNKEEDNFDLSKEEKKETDSYADDDYKMRDLEDETNNVLKHNELSESDQNDNLNGNNFQLSKNKESLETTGEDLKMEVDSTVDDLEFVGYSPVPSESDDE